MEFARLYSSLHLEDFLTIIRQYFPKVSKELKNHLILSTSSTKVETVSDMTEAHSSSEFEVNQEGLDLLLCHPEYVQV